MEVLVEAAGRNMLPFLAKLDWIYIITFILICYGYQSIEKHINWKFIKGIKKRFKVALIGLLYAPIYYLLWGLEKDQIGILFSSFLISFAFHKLLVDAIIGTIKVKFAKFNFLKPKGGYYE
jgi:hypothetical protein